MVTLAYLLWWFSGLGLGLVYFACLWWSIGRSLTQAGQGWYGLLLLRMGGLLGGLLLLIGPNPLGLIIALGGIITARWGGQWWLWRHSSHEQTTSPPTS